MLPSVLSVSLLPCSIVDLSFNSNNVWSLILHSIFKSSRILEKNILPLQFKLRIPILSISDEGSLWNIYWMAIVCYILIGQGDNKSEYSMIIPLRNSQAAGKMAIKVIWKFFERMLDKLQCTHNQKESMGIRENFTEEMALRCPALRGVGKAFQAKRKAWANLWEMGEWALWLSMEASPVG